MKRRLMVAFATVCATVFADVNPYAAETRQVIQTPDGGWVRAVSPDNSLDLSKMPAVEWNKRGAQVKPAVSWGIRQMGAVVDRETGKLRKPEGPFVEWWKKTVDVPENVLKGHAAFFYICKARYGFTLFVNGKHVGTSYQACCEKEMDVTPYLKAGANEIVFGITTSEGMWDPVKKCARAPFYAYGDGMRWEGPVRLEFRPMTFIDDVFVETFLKTREVVYHLTLKNVSEKDETVTPHVRVSPEEDYFRPHLVITGEKVKVPAKGEIEVTYRREWPKDKKLLLWDAAEGQWMYLARVTLLDGDERVDQYDQTYGFREIEVRGRDIFLNGERIFLSRWSMMGCLNDFEHWDYGRWHLGRNDRNAVRYHLGSQALWMASWGDRKGIIQIPELGCMCFNPETSPINPDSLDEFCKSRTRWWRNRPSAVMYSLENETVWNSTEPLWDDFCAKYLATMRKYAPNAIFQADAGNTWNGKLDVNNIHYPEGEAGTLRKKYANAGFQLPNDLKWIDPVKGAPGGGWRTNPFDWSKPLVIGEFYCFPLPSYSGDRLFDPNLYDFEDPAGSKGIDYPSPLADNPGEMALRMMCTWYRICGVAGLNPWVRSHSYALDPCVCDPLDFRPNWPAGGTFERTVGLINDGGCPFEHVFWTLDSDEVDFHTGGDIRVQVNQGSNAVVKIAAQLPRTEKPLKLKLKVRAAYKVFEQARYHETVYVLPTSYDMSAYAGEIGVIGDGADALLAQLGLAKAVKLDGRTLPENLRLILVARDALKPAHRKMLDRFFALGGTVLVLHQKDWAPYRSELPVADLNHAATWSFVRAKGHPVLDGLEEAQLKCWGADNLVSTETFVKPAEGDFTAILECGGQRSLKWTPLVEIKVDKGRAILNSFANSDDPVVLKLLANTVRYATATKTDPAESRRLGVLAGSNGQIKAFLARTFVDVAASPTEGTCLLVDASAAKDAAKDVAAMLAKGGTVWLHNADTESARLALGEELAKKLVFSPTPKDVLFGPKTPAGDRWLLNGAANEDLAWCIPPTPGEQWSVTGADNYWKAATKTCEPPKFSVEGADGLPFGEFQRLTRPGLLAVLKVGKRAQVLLDCLPWEISVQKEPEKTLRTVSTLARNLGCAFRTVEKPKYSFRKLDLAKFCNMGYWDRVAGDGLDGWTDQGRNDMRMFLINHTGKNNYEDEGMETPVPPFPTEQVFNDVPFHLTDPKRNGGKGVISLGSVIAPKLMKEAKGIPVNSTFELLNVVHASAWMQQEAGKPIAKFVVNYEDGTSADLFVNAIEHICDWQNYHGGANCRLAWIGENKVASVSLNQSAFKNPHPEKVVKSLDIVGALHHAQYVVLGMTLATERKPLGELEPVLALKADFSKEKYFDDYFPGNWYGSYHGTPTPDGMVCTNGIGYASIGGIPDKSPVRKFQRSPFEVRVGFTLHKTPQEIGRGGIFSFMGGGFHVQGGVLFAFEKRLGHQPQAGERCEGVIRFDGQNLWLYLNGNLEFTEDAGGYSFMDMDMLHVGWSNIPMTLHKLEFYRLVEKK